MRKNICFLILAGTFSVSVFAQSNLGWLKETPITKFGKADVQTVVKTLNQALDSGEDGVPLTWENADAKNSGSVTPSPDPEGRPGCRSARVENRHMTLHNTSDLVFCKVNGKWTPAQK